MLISIFSIEIKYAMIIMFNKNEKNTITLVKLMNYDNQ